MRKVAGVVSVLGFVLFSALALVPVAGAETLVESNVENRVFIYFRVNQAELQKWIPTPWQIDAIQAGPNKDANIFFAFVHPLLRQGPDGKPVTPTGTSRFVVLAVPAKHPQTGESRLFVIRAYTSDHAGLPGAYKNYVKATVSREQTLKGENLEQGVATELWEMRSDTGTLHLRFAYQRGTPSRAKGDLKVYSAVEPDFFRIYRVDRGVDVVKSVPAGVDRVQGYEFRTTVSELAKLFDGSEQLVSISVLPWYVRQVFLP